MTPEFRKAIFELAPETLGLVFDEKGFISNCPSSSSSSSSSFSSTKNEEEAELEKVALQEAKLQVLSTELEGMGFARGRAMKALRTLPTTLLQRDGEAVEKAVEWLCSHFEEEEEEATAAAAAQQQQQQQQQQMSQKRRVKRMLVELQRLFAKLEVENSWSVSTGALTKSFGWSQESRAHTQQHDVHELSRVLFDAIETSLRDTPKQQLLNNLYRGFTVDKITCLVCKRESYSHPLTCSLIPHSLLPLFNENSFFLLGS
jgi:uncharacterized UBP type Zn finger protein